MVMKRGSIQPYGASAWQSKAALKKLRFTRFRTAPGPRGPPKNRNYIPGKLRRPCYVDRKEINYLAHIMIVCSTEEIVTLEPPYPIPCADACERGNK